MGERVRNDQVQKASRILRLAASVIAHRVNDGLGTTFLGWCKTMVSRRCDAKLGCLEGSWPWCGKSKSLWDVTLASLVVCGHGINALPDEFIKPKPNIHRVRSPHAACAHLRLIKCCSEAQVQVGSSRTSRNKVKRHCKYYKEARFRCTVVGAGFSAKCAHDGGKSSFSHRQGDNKAQLGGSGGRWGKEGCRKFLND